MKVLHVITGLGDGGAEGMLYRLCSHLPEVTHVVVSLMDEGKYGPLLRDAGVAVHCLGMPRGRLTGRGLLSLWQLMRRERPDVVQTWMYHADLIGGLIARLAGIRAVSWNIRHSTLLTGRTAGTTLFVARVCAKLSCIIPRKIICCSEKAVQVHQDLGYCAKKFEVIPNGYDLGRFLINKEAGKRLRREWGIDDDLPLLGMVARYDPLKDHRTLLAALRTLQKKGLRFFCVLVGTDMVETNAALVDLVNGEGLNAHVLLLGRRNDIPDIMNALDLHVLSSLGEAFPNVLAEAMACGTPCVATDVGDAALIIGEAGWIVRPEDPEALAEGITTALTILSDLKTRKIVAERARSRVSSRFDINNIVQIYHKAWLSLKT